MNPDENSAAPLVDGIVDVDAEHFEFTYGEDRRPVAFLGRGDDGGFIFQFGWPLDVEPGDALEAIRREIDFYFVFLNEPDPWLYAMYHCGASANVYSNVHWHYYPAGHPHQSNLEDV